MAKATNSSVKEMIKLFVGAILLAFLNNVAVADLAPAPKNLDVPIENLAVVGTITGNFDKEKKIYTFFMLRNDGAIRRCSISDSADMSNETTDYFCSFWATPFYYLKDPPQ